MQRNPNRKPTTKKIRFLLSSASLLCKCMAIKVIANNARTPRHFSRLCFRRFGSVRGFFALCFLSRHFHRAQMFTISFRKLFHVVAFSRGFPLPRFTRSHFSWCATPAVCFVLRVFPFRCWRATRKCAQLTSFRRKRNKQTAQVKTGYFPSMP